MTERVTLGEARRLWDAGFRGETHFWWLVVKDTEKIICCPSESLRKAVERDGGELIPCPVVCDILEKLPAEIKHKRTTYDLVLQKKLFDAGNRVLYVVGYYKRAEMLWGSNSVRLEKACADLYCWLAKEGLLPKENVK